MKHAVILYALMLYAGRVQAQTSTVTAPPPDAKQVEHMQSQLMDWPNLGRYQAENATLPPPAEPDQRVVFFGDSITDNWGRSRATFFPGKPYVNRGISGQATPQMLLRFQQDVVHLHPAVVVLLGGTNDIAGNTGPSTPQMIEDNIASMIAVAKANGIKFVLASITPAAAYPWRQSVHPVDAIREVNAWSRSYCASQGCIYLDYYSAMSDANGAMLPGLSSDGVHPTAKGYDVMGPLAEKAIAQVLAQ